jgi:hypothetical protein
MPPAKLENCLSVVGGGDGILGPIGNAGKDKWGVPLHALLIVLLQGQAEIQLVCEVLMWLRGRPKT